MSKYDRGYLHNGGLSGFDMNKIQCSGMQINHPECDYSPFLKKTKNAERKLSVLVVMSY